MCRVFHSKLHWKQVAFFSMYACLLLAMYSWNQCVHAEAETSVITASPSRIIVFPLYAEEILLDLVGPDHIVYVGHNYVGEDGDLYSPTMHLTQQIPGSNWQCCDEEYLIALHPDLVILDSELSRDYQDIFPNLVQTNAAFLFLDTPNSFDEIKSTILHLGHVVDRGEKAQKLIEKFDTELSAIDNFVKMIPEERWPRVVYYEECYEEYPSLFSSIAQTAGVTNFSSSFASDSSIAHWNPDIICFCPYGLDTDGSLYSIGQEYTTSYFSRIITNATLCNVNAVQTQRVFPLSIYKSQYAILSVKALLSIVYPEILSEYNKDVPRDHE